MISRIIFLILCVMTAKAGVGNCYLSTHPQAAILGAKNLSRLEGLFHNIQKGSEYGQSFETTLRKLVSEKFSAEDVEFVESQIRNLLYYRSLQKIGILEKDITIPNRTSVNSTVKQTSALSKSYGANHQLLMSEYLPTTKKLIVRFPKESTQSLESSVELISDLFGKMQAINVHWIQENILLLSDSSGKIIRVLKADGKWRLDESSIFKVYDGLLKLRSYNGTQFISSHTNGEIYFWDSSKKEPVLINEGFDTSSLDAIDFQFLSARNFSLFNSSKIEFSFLNPKTGNLQIYLEHRYSEKSGMLSYDRILKLYPQEEGKIISVQKNGDLKLWSLKNSKFEVLMMLDKDQAYEESLIYSIP